MTDIVERLRGLVILHGSNSPLMSDAIGYIEFLESSWAKCREDREAAEIETMEQARLLGMSGEREASLRGEIERLRKIEAAAKNLIAVRGRHHAELAYKRLEESLK